MTTTLNSSEPGNDGTVKRIVVKLGTSTLTKDGGPLDRDFIADLAAQIAAQRDLGRSVVLVSSGAIRAGMDSLQMQGRPRTIPQKQAAAAIGQSLLMHIYAEAFAKHGIPVGQVLLTRDDIRDRSRYLNARNTFAALIKFGAVPIVNENDTVAIDEIKFGDNDTLAALVASLAEADELLLLSDVGGLFDKDPTQFSDAQHIAVVEKIDKSIETLAGGARTSVGTGGMATKIKAAKICAGAGIRTRIADGRRVNVIADALSGACGTLFLPNPNRLRHRQRWIAYGIIPNGTVAVNDGAKERLVNEGKSLLPVGVIQVVGNFRPGELVRLVDTQGRPFAQGFVNYAHDDLLKIMGRRTADIAEVLGTKPSDEVVHRDNLVLDL